MPKNKGGRPATGKRFPVERKILFDVMLNDKMQALATAKNSFVSILIRDILNDYLDQPEIKILIQPILDDLEIKK